MSSPSSPEFLVVDNGNQSRRKSKRLIPDDEKDAKYWEKRLKNNEAAKRSREHKRQLDNLTRNRVRNLEEENALLRRELSLLKVKFNLPDSQSLLSHKDREKCAALAIEKEHLLKEASKCDPNELLSTIKIEAPAFESFVSKDGSQLPLPLLARLSRSGEPSSLESHDQSMQTFNDDRLFHYSQKDLGTPPKAHSPGDENKMYETTCDEETVPADLTVTKRKRKHDDSELLGLSRFSQDRNNDTYDISSEIIPKKSIDTNAKERNDICETRYAQELQEKLQSLSDHVMIMQKQVQF